MKLIRILIKNIRDGLRSTIRNLSLSVSSIVCISITLFIISIVTILSLNIKNFTDLIKKDFTVVVFVDNASTSKETEVLHKNLKKLENISEIKYESKMQVADEMKKSSEVFDSIFSNWSEGENPLQDTFLIKVKDTSMINKTAEEIEKLKNVYIVKYGKGIVEEVLVVFNAIEKGLIVSVLSLILVSIFLITNTIKITIYSRKKEIEIKRLVGASNFSIKQPFIVEGFFLGLIGAIAPILLTIYGYSALFTHFSGQLFSPFISLLSPEPFIYILSLVLLAIGIVVGMIGSLQAARKYLKI